MPERPGRPRQAPSQRLRCVAIDQANREGLFDDAGFPIGHDWDEIDFPNVEDEHAYALEVRGDAMLPIYRDGDLLVLSPVANVRRHDRIVLKTSEGALLPGMLVRRTAQRIEFAPFGDATTVQTFPIREVAWLARILWVSQ